MPRYESVHSGALYLIDLLPLRNRRLPILSLSHESNAENPKTGCGPFGARTLFSGKLSQFCDSLNLYNIDIEALVDRAFTFIVTHSDRADLTRVTNMRSAIGLQIQADDLHRAYLHDPFR
jgi:hypothetical protein